MRVAILVKEFPPDVIGGTETQTKRLASALESYGDHDVTVFTKSYPEPTDLSVDYELVRVPTWHLTPFISTLTFILGAFFLMLYRHREFDVLQSMMVYPTGFVGYLCGKLTELPYFAWIRGGDYYFMKENRIKRWTIQKVLSDTLVLVQTPRIRKDVHREFPEADLSVLGNGVEVPPETASGDAVIFVGRLEKQKGVHILVEAMAGTDERLLIVGDGSQRTALEERAAELGVNAEFAGEVSPEDVADHLHYGKVFVLPSIRGEGLPNAMLEAMAVGLPVIVTDTGGVADGVREGETGYVVPPGDAGALRDRIRTLCSDEALRESMATRARTYVKENHRWSHLVDELENIYDTVRESER
jgi:glycosyltransferase involved in cell wall biosynthesis